MFCYFERWSEWRSVIGLVFICVSLWIGGRFLLSLVVICYFMVIWFFYREIWLQCSLCLIKRYFFTMNNVDSGVPSDSIFFLCILIELWCFFWYSVVILGCWCFIMLFGYMQALWNQKMFLIANAVISSILESWLKLEGS